MMNQTISSSLETEYCHAPNESTVLPWECISLSSFSIQNPYNPCKRFRETLPLAQIEW